MAVLAMYDASGIQNYIFTTGKLKENIGASNLVADVLKKILVMCIMEFYPKDKCFLEWENADEAGLSKEYEAEVVYIGGGNAMVCFDCEEKATLVTEAFYKKLITKTYQVRVISAFTHVTDDFKEDRQRLLVRIDAEKRLQKPFSLMKGFSINRQDNITTDPFIVNLSQNDKLHISSRESYLKQKAYSDEKARENRNIDLVDKDFDENFDINFNDKEFIDESFSEKFTFDGVFDNLGGEKGNNMLAVVHIDGNSLGAVIGNHMSKFNSYGQAISEFRKLSSQINQSYRNAYKALIKELCQYLSDEGNIDYLEENNIKIRQNKDYRNHKTKHILPIRHLIFEGDDVTFVCNAKLAFNLVERFIKLLKPLAITERDMHACAGIVFVHAHFPFSIAYELAEECCASAKKRAKLLDEKNPLSWIDFHLSTSGSTGSLDSIRNRWYSMPDYKLLRRPWLINKGEEAKKDLYKDYSFDILKQYVEMFNERAKSENSKFSDFKWPRNKLKGLRNAYLKGESNVNLYMAELCSRVIQKSNNGNGDMENDWKDPMLNIDGSKISRYFDVVEALDMLSDVEIF